MNNCATCYNQNSCDSCANGFLTYYTNVDTEIKACRKCSDAIPGCQMCGKASSCDQCSNEFLSMNGLCYEKNGKAIAGSVS